MTSPRDLPAFVAWDAPPPVLDRPTCTSDILKGRAAAGIALHMHQPIMPAPDASESLETAPLISNLKYMLENQHIHGNHDAPKMIECYERMGWIIPRLIDEGFRPRVALEYSGCLLHGLAQLGELGESVLRNLKLLATDKRCVDAVEFLGAPWGHAVAPSTPPADFRLHVYAWRSHFAALFGNEALSRVRCFSPSEMALPNDPDVAYTFVSTLLEAGYDSVLVQEHTIEDMDGAGVRTPHVPHRLVCRNSEGQECSIAAVIKTQGSDTKLVGQMQPFYEAASIHSECEIRGVKIPHFVFQISDGENGGVIMNEFVGKFEEVTKSQSPSSPPLVTISEYLDHVRSLGITLADLPACRPRFQGRIFNLVDSGKCPTVAAAIEHLKGSDHAFSLEGGSWTNDISWVKGYGDELNRMLELSAALWAVRNSERQPAGPDAWRNALYHLLCSQTSCFRYWGKGAWTERGNEICRRGLEILKHDFK
ncbi:hypothetical protein DFJ74DRAFT_20185 [Hyaloraphidium curvatum]|nr:hypothetical protein DFJ74DRAFT_20185 [Hyaloraphidium curvatum]